MPYKTLNAPRKVASLGAEIRGAAMLSSPSVVAMVSTDPVRLAIQPSSGTAKVVNVALQGADDLGFLSKDVALVRSGDDVWALIDITHQPKMEQVGRDARLLSAHPGGESALLLSWDGTATAFGLNKYEVVPRQFALRGTVRSLEVGATETFVVVDGAEGGELRVHPGATPEPGAKDRATLPRGASKLDRLHGGRDLAVVYKRGGRELCVVTRTGGKLAAKLIQLRDGALDVAVMDTSLFATFPDGRIDLYDGDAVGRAGDAPIEATHSLSLGVAGEPRILHAAGRGALWVGSSAGDVVQLAAARKTPPGGSLT